MRGHRCELRPRRQQRGQMKHQLDAKFRQHPLEHAAIEDRSRNLAIDLGGDRAVEPVQIERHDGAIAALGEPRDQPVANLAAGAGDEDNWFAHARIILVFRQRTHGASLLKQILLSAMFRLLAAFTVLRSVLPAQLQPASSFDALFTGDTMRVDYFHTGGPKAGETISLDRVVNDGDVGRAAERSSSIRPISASTGSRFARQRAGRRCTRAASRRSTANGRRPASRRRPTGPSTSRCDFRGRRSRSR